MNLRRIESFNLTYETCIAFAYLPKDGAIRGETDKAFADAVKYELNRGFKVAGSPYLLPQTDHEWPRICVLMTKQIPERSAINEIHD